MTEPFIQAWLYLRKAFDYAAASKRFQDKTGQPYPSGMKPLGTYGEGDDARRIMMLGDIPYYQSTGSSPSNDSFKESGGWYPFAGIDPDRSARTDWYGDGRGEWWVKDPNVTNREGTKRLSEKVGSHGDWADDPNAEMSGYGRAISGYEPYIPESAWPQIETSQGVNEALAARGWNADEWRFGEHPQTQPQSGDIRYQQQQQGLPWKQ